MHCRTITQKNALTLMELLVVIAIIGILAAIGVPAIQGLTKTNTSRFAAQQLEDDLARARTQAISERTTVYMVFVPTNIFDYYDLSASPTNAIARRDFRRDTNLVYQLLDNKFTTYALFTRRGVGQQPGQTRPRYLTEWKSLKDGNFIDPEKFASLGETMAADWVNAVTTDPINSPLPYSYFPFPTGTSSQSVPMPYIAFNHLGQLVQPDYYSIPINRQEPLVLRVLNGNIFYSRGTVPNNPDAVGPVLDDPPEVVSNTDQSLADLVYIDWLTGRAEVREPQIEF